MRSHTPLVAAFRPTSMGCALLLAAAAAGAAGPATSPSSADIEASRAACARLATEDEKKTCLREAGAARAEARRGQLRNANTDYERNAVQRCEALPAEDRPACESRVRGEGFSSGSVEGGGIYRETREIVPAEPAER